MSIIDSLKKLKEILYGESVNEEQITNKVSNKNKNRGYGARIVDKLERDD